MNPRFKIDVNTPPQCQNKLIGMHPDIIISDAPPTKLRMFLHNINPFKRFNKERERVFKMFKCTI